MDYTYRGRTVTEKQYQALALRRSSGVCPFCERACKENYGAMRRHITACVEKIGWRKEGPFPMDHVRLEA